jgi:alpha-glucosidase
MKILLRYGFAFCFISALSLPATAIQHEVRSPDGQLALTIDLKKGFLWSVTKGQDQVIEPSKIDLVVKGQGALFGERRLNPMGVQKSEMDEQIEPVVRYKSATVRNQYNGLTLTFVNDVAVEFRVFNDAVAYRFNTVLDGQVRIEDEVLQLEFPKKSRTLFPEEETMISHYERLYLDTHVEDLAQNRFASLPLLVETPDSHKVVFTEADLVNYPGLFMSGTGDTGLSSKFMPFVSQAQPMQGSEDRNQVLEYADYIAEVKGARDYPWRVAVIGDDADLLNSQHVFLLSRELQIENPDWIKPGRVAWDWYNALNLFGVDFKTGIDNTTYKYYIDFASKYGIEYVILDEGWSISTTDVSQPNPNIDVPELVAYGKERGVQIILWSLWGPMDQHYKTLLPLYEKWGVAGVKIDFMQRSDQYMVEYYERIAREAAKHKLLVNYHGGFKPAGLRRAYPNVVSYEGVKGNENNKWSQDITPEHNVTIPFIRMLAGPMDYTPGAMSNARLENHQINHFRPMSIGTRAHQVAMYGIYESALQMYCDSPSKYLQDEATIGFASQFPSVWDESRVLEAKVGDYVVMARRSGDAWFISAMTDGAPREFSLDVSFMGEGLRNMEYFADGVNTENYAEDYSHGIVQKNLSSPLNIRLAAGGGWSAIIKP